MYLCRRCGLAFEAGPDALIRLQPLIAGITTELAYPAMVRYLAVWRFEAKVEVRGKESRSGAPPEHVWESVRRAAAPAEPVLYVPAFAFGRLVVQQLGAGLVQEQPRLELTEGVPLEGPHLSVLSGDTSSAGDAADASEGPGFGTVSPVRLAKADAEVVAHYVYLAVENRGTIDLRRIDYELSLGAAHLIFIPAVYDRRHVRDSGWRFLLREFDRLVA